MARLTAQVGKRTKKGTLVTKRQAGAAEAEATDYLLIREDNSRQYAEMLNQALARAMEEIGLLAERFAKENLTASGAVDTGRLRNSVTHAVDSGEKAVYVGTNVEYGPYVELGTSRMDPRPYLVPAAQEHGDEYRQALKKNLGSGS